MGSLRDRMLDAAGPERAAAMEAESRTWMMTCTKCGADQSVWDIGGVRYKASSKGKRSYVRCTTCGKRFFARIEQRTA